MGGEKVRFFPTFVPMFKNDIQIKAGFISNLSDARYFAPLAEWIGLNVDTGETGYIDLEKAAEIISWLSGPAIVAECGEADENAVNEILQTLPEVSFIQSRITLNKDKLIRPETGIIRHIVLDELWTSDSLLTCIVHEESQTAYFLLDCHHYSWEDLKKSSSSNGISLPFLKDLLEQYSIILDMPFSPETLTEIIHTLPLKYLQLKGGEEEKTGIRSFEELDSLLAVLEED